MLIGEMNPFLRYANNSSFSPANDFVCTYDCRLFYVISGSCKIQIEKAEYNILRGSLVLLQQGTKYRFKSISNIKIIVLNFDYTHQHSENAESFTPVLYKNRDMALLVPQIDFEDCCCLCQPLVINNQQLLQTDLQQITEEFSSKKLYYRERSSAILKKCIISAVREASFPSGGAYSKLDTVIEYIKSNYGSDISNELLGRLVGYNSYYLNRLIFKQTGTTLKQYILNYRLEMAKNLLISTDYYVAEIAEMCGFNNAAYFSNCFKSHLSQTPKQFRTEGAKLL